MAKKKNKTFWIQAEIQLTTSIEIEAESLTDAITKSKELGLESFVELKGDNIDYDLEITGSYKAGE